MGVSFLPVRGVKGTGIERMHPEYARVTCPFTGDELVVVPPLRPDVALLHAPIGDARGNLHLDQPYVLDVRFAMASRMVVATVDRLGTTEEVAAAGVTIPAHTVAAVVEAPFGAHPSSCYPGYAYDRPHLAAYLEAAGSGDVTAYLDAYVHAGEDAYRAAVDPERLTRWSGSVADWQELFR
jgi:glutaconate CoA-transferase, subunit A